jgi:GntR family transcriptional repressor for pyruvate dehydrogenase complex
MIGSMDFEQPASQRPDPLFHSHERRGTVGQLLLRQLIDLLEAGRLRPGEKLPPERELAQLLGVSRPSVRQALGALGLIGIVEARQGSGTYLARSLVSFPLEPYICRLLLNDGSFGELMDLRLALEPMVARMAAEHASPESHTVLRRLLSDYDVAMSRADATPELARLAAGFHHALAQASGNQLFVHLLASVGDLLEAAGRRILERSPVANHDAHRRILAAVTSRDQDLAERLMRDHLRVIARQLQASGHGTASARA